MPMDPYVDIKAFFLILFLDHGRLEKGGDWAQNWKTRATTVATNPLR